MLAQECYPGRNAGGSLDRPYVEAVLRPEASGLVVSMFAGI